MDNWKVWIETLQKKPYSALGLLILFAIPVTLILVFRSQDTRSSASAPESLITNESLTQANQLDTTPINKPPTKPNQTYTESETKNIDEANFIEEFIQNIINSVKNLFKD